MKDCVEIVSLQRYVDALEVRIHCNIARSCFATNLTIIHAYADSRDTLVEKKTGS